MREPRTHNAEQQCAIKRERNYLATVRKNKNQCTAMAVFCALTTYEVLRIQTQKKK